MYPRKHRQADPAARGGDFQEAQPAARTQHPEKLGEGAAQIGQVPQGVSHRQKIERGPRERDLLADAHHRGDFQGVDRPAHHAGAGVQADDKFWIPNQRDLFASDESGADGDIQNFHAARQPCPVQGLSAIPAPAAKGKQPLDVVVIRAVSSKIPRRNPRFTGSAGVIGAERRVWGQAFGFDQQHGRGVYPRLPLAAPHRIYPLRMRAISAFNPVVIAPTFNNARTLHCILSGIGDLGLPIIVVDDGCTDGNAAILQGWHEEARPALWSLTWRIAEKPPRFAAVLFARRQWDSPMR